MKAACPRCGRNTELDSETGDFPTRCIRCGALVRRRVDGPEAGAPELAVPAATRVQRGMLAGLLISQSDSQTAVIHARTATVMERSQVQSHGVLRPESRKEILRARARQQALARAELRSNQQALKALTWAGLILVLILGVGAIALKAQSMWRHPSPARADVLRVQ